MVARFIAGKDLAGIVYYNEDKVERGEAHCLAAEGFARTADELAVKEKIRRLQELAGRNRMARTNAVHISLNFDPEERLDEQTLLAIAASYINQVGFGGQPYIVYQHFDAGHPHIHIATTNIRKDGSRIPLHNIGEQYSEPARKAIEKDFGLIPAEGRQPADIYTLNPVDLQVVHYGKQPTKAAISKVVRTVVRGYRYTSLAELNAVLNRLNVLADRGEPGSAMYERGGLVYSLINPQGEKTGIPIKSSSIYEQPTLKQLEHRFKDNLERRKPYKARLVRLIEQALQAGKDREGFEKDLEQSGIQVVWRQNAEGHLYGITFVDHKTRCVFNGSDLGKGYGMKGITARLIGYTHPDHHLNRLQVAKMLDGTDFSKGIQQVLRAWHKSGLRIHVVTDGEQWHCYLLGMAGTATSTYVPADDKLTAYLAVHRVKDHPPEPPTAGGSAGRKPTGPPSSNYTTADALQDRALQETNQLIRDLVTVTYVDDYVPPELLKEARKKKQRRRRH